MEMKKALVLMMSGALVLSACDSYTATGGYVGSGIGQVVGSSIGGITGGWRGHETGRLIGMVGGAVAGAAIGAAVDNAQQRKYEQARRVRPHQGAGERQSEQPAYDPAMKGDDRISFDGDDGYEGMEGAAPTLEIRHARVIDGSHDGVLTRGEECTVVFEVMNLTGNTVRDVYPLVEDVTGNKHVKISPNLRVESIAPFQGIRYTATILADKKLKDGEIVVRVGVRQGLNGKASQTQEFKIPTKKKVEG